MEKFKQILFSGAVWVFVGFCLLMAIGMPFGIGTILMLLAAVIAAPIKAIHNIWDAVLEKLPQQKGLFTSKKKQAAKREATARSAKALIITLVFLFGFIFGMASMEASDPAAPSEPGFSTEAPTGTSAPATTPSSGPTTASTSPTTTGAPTVPATTAPATTAPITTTTPPAATTPTTTPPAPTQPANSTFSIHFIDVGQADAALVECDGHYLLIDGGNKADSNVIYSVLKKAAVPKLDIVVGTHAHEDHIGGLPGAFNYTTSDLTLCPVKSYDSNAFEDFARYANQKGGGITIPKVGDTYSLGSATVKILGVNGGSDTNDTSIVLRIDYGETSFLFTGDAEREAEQAILNSGANLKTTVLKVGHHGSDTSTSYPFLREIMPQYAVISVGTDNSYGHPTEDALSRLRDAEVKVFRTDLQGDVFCTSDGKTVIFSVSRNADIDVFGNIGSNSTQQTQPQETDPPETEPQGAGTEDIMVWIPKSGKKYHSYAGCSGMKNPRQVTKDEAEALGLTPCSKCW